MKAHIWESGHTVLSLSVTNPGRSTALCAWERNRNSADTSAFRTVISCLSRNVPYYHISQKKEKKLQIIATQRLEIEAGSEEKPSNCCTVPHCLCQCLPSTSPSALPSCWRTASVSAQPQTMHTAQGLREDMLWPQHIFPHSLSNLGPHRHPWNAPHSAEHFHLPSIAIVGGNSTASLVIRSHLSLLQPLGFHWILDQWGFGTGSHNAND